MKNAENSRKALRFSPVKREASLLKRYNEEVQVPDWAKVEEAEVEFTFSDLPSENPPAPYATIGR